MLTGVEFIRLGYVGTGHALVRLIGMMLNGFVAILMDLWRYSNRIQRNIDRKHHRMVRLYVRFDHRRRNSCIHECIKYRSRYNFTIH